VRALALADDLIVFVSRIWQTSCVAVRAGEEGFVIDSPVYPDELAALPDVLAQASFPVSGLLATHGDWDHLLGRLAFPQASLGVGEPTARRLAAEPGVAARELRRFDEQHYIERERPLSLAGVQSLPVPGRLELGAERELELHPAAGHTCDGTAFWLGWRGALVCGDYLSPVEIPVLGPCGDASAYLETLARLEPLIARARHVIPGHGAPLEREHALALLGEDRGYLEGLLREGEARLPQGRRSARQREIDAANRAALSRARGAA
jgi:glyoxylase-like metal-dependent hydrolase (beta-lactamase superfamily II)